MNEANKNNYKQYASRELFNLIKGKIPEDKYGEFTVLIYEILLRRAYTFDISKEQLTIEIDRLLENCEVIEFSDNFKNSRILGHYLPNSKTIQINGEKFSKLPPNYEKIFEVLTHEVYHALAPKKEVGNELYSGLRKYSYENKKWSGTRLNEVFNECAADLASYSRTENTEKKRLSSNYRIHFNNICCSYIGCCPWNNRKGTYKSWN